VVAEKTLIETFIEEQQRLTAVERFASQHDSHELLLPSHRFRDLLPATAPGPGEQYAFEVHLDKCSGCKACVTACHSLNGLDDNETWREVGLLIEAPKPRRNRINIEVPKPFTGTATSLQHVTTACHHCVDPACLNGCPVLAYDKDPTTGIVRHLDDQCIGCQYCVLKCPYDVPKYNSRLGIVRKCDMCSNRLSVGEAPACAQACPNEAIRITKVQTETVTIGFRERAATFLAGAPAGDYTVPTTHYVSTTTNQLTAADHGELKPQAPHWPLVFMLVLSQASVGAVCASLFSAASSALLWLALALASVGLGASVFHLGRPLGAWRAFLNLRRSWMSREIVAFGVFPPLVAGALVVPMLTPVAALAGIAAVFCSAMIYIDTRRELWRAARTLPLFFTTALMLGAASAVVFLPTNVWFAAALVALTVVKLTIEVLSVRHVTNRALTPMRKSALLITGTFQPVALARCVIAIGAGIGIPVLLSTKALPAPELFSIAALALLILGEVCERYLFFRCVVAPKMPGGRAA
jgi:formate dehydrogenase iron-sulfur subunit